LDEQLKYRKRRKRCFDSRKIDAYRINDEINRVKRNRFLMT